VQPVRTARDAVHHGLDQRPRREALAGAGLDVLRVALQQPLVGVAIHVGIADQFSASTRSTITRRRLAGSSNFIYALPKISTHLAEDAR
jgi:hypothetical protein